MASRSFRPRGHVSLERALSKLGLASRTEARRLISQGRVSVNGHVQRDPRTAVVPERMAVAIDGKPSQARATRVIAFHKPRGVVTTRRDPQGRRTVFDVLGSAGRGLIAVGRLDMASTGLLLLTNDTQLANRLTDPVASVVRRYAVTVRGRVDPDAAGRLERGIATPIVDGRIVQLRAAHVRIRKTSERETHLIVELTEGKNREIRRLFDAIRHDVTRLHRVAFGPIELGRLQPGEWRDVTGALSLEP